MRLLIDGYNVMYAAGLMNQVRGPKGLHFARQRFLDRLASAAPNSTEADVTVVFDAEAAPPGFSRLARYKGLEIEFAIDEADADSRIEDRIAADPTPKTLTVVSSDHRLRKAAERRKAQWLSADAFLERLSEWTRRPSTSARTRRPEPQPERPEAASAEEIELWMRVFETAKAEAEDTSGPSASWVPDDEEMARILEEVDEEFQSRMASFSRSSRR